MANNSSKALRAPLDDEGKLFSQRQALLEYCIEEIKKLAPNGGAIAVSGSRGAGKTSFLRLMQKRINKEQQSEDQQNKEKLNFTLFNPLLCLNTVSSLQKEDNEKCKSQADCIVNIQKTADRWRFAAALLEGLINYVLKKKCVSNQDEEQLQSVREIASVLEVHETDFTSWVMQIADDDNHLFELMHSLAMKRPGAASLARDHIEKLVKTVLSCGQNNQENNKDECILVIIDDLDLAPHRAFSILEDLWTYLCRIPKLVFIVAFDYKTLELTVAHKLKKEIGAPEDLITDLSHSLILKTFDAWIPLSLPSLNECRELVESEHKEFGLLKELLYYSTPFKKFLWELTSSNGVDNTNKINATTSSYLNHNLWIKDFLALFSFSTREIIDFGLFLNSIKNVEFKGVSWNKIEEIWPKLNGVDDIKAETNCQSQNQFDLNTYFQAHIEEKKFLRILTQLLARSMLLYGVFFISYPNWDLFSTVRERPSLLFLDAPQDTNDKKIKTLKAHFRKELLIPLGDVDLYLEEGRFFLKWLKMNFKDP